MKPVMLDGFFEELARLSGEAILPFFRSAIAVQHKPGDRGFDPVTEADRAAELVIRRRIREAFPTHGIQGEEFPPERSDAEYQWIIDPIDGTKAFICGLPVWGTLIGLARRGAPVYGIMHQPFVGDLFAGDGARAVLKSPRGERKLSVRSCPTLAEAVLATTSPLMFGADTIERYRAIEAAVRLPRYGTDCYAYAMLAAGQIDLVVEAGLKPHDVAALIPIVEGAGGIITTWQGESAMAGGAIVAACDPRLHEAAIALLTA